MSLAYADSPESASPDMWNISSGFVNNNEDLEAMCKELPLEPLSHYLNFKPLKILYQ